MENNYAVIMAGGIGSRFWPMSRTNYPKQFIDILGTGRTLFETDPFGHGKGTDTPSFVYYARGKGNLYIDNLHNNSRIIKLESMLKGEENVTRKEPLQREIKEIN